MHDVFIRNGIKKLRKILLRRVSARKSTCRDNELYKRTVQIKIRELVPPKNRQYKLVMTECTTGSTFVHNAKTYMQKKEKVIVSTSASALHIG